MKAILGITFLIVLALETESFSAMALQLGMILAITAIFYAIDKRDQRIHKLKSDYWSAKCYKQ
jgi:archaellum biogenesis protein FlaJ (TadC family)